MRGMGPQVQLDTSGWKRLYPTNIPRQDNDWDCGVFTAMYAERFGQHGAQQGRRRRLGFSQSDMPYLRQKMTCQLVQLRVE